MATTIPAATVPAATVAVTTVPVTPGFTLDELARHASTDNCWLLISGRMYDVTAYLSSHPGGTRTITPWCGKESTTAFATEGGRGEHSPFAYSDLERFYIGNLSG